MIAAHLPRTSRRIVGVVACIGMALPSPQPAHGAPAAHIETPAIDTAAIPPGREELFAAMLGRGAALPDACTFTAGQIERTVVRGVYACPGGEVGLELRHTSGAPADAIRTEKMAIVTVRGTPPPTLLAALAELVRQRENAFEWLKPETLAAPTYEASEEASEEAGDAAGCVSLAPLPSILDPYFPGCYPLFAALLVGIAQTVVMVLGLGYGLFHLSRTPNSPNAARKGDEEEIPRLN